MSIIYTNNPYLYTQKTIPFTQTNRINMGLLIYKASAGSGKTFTLAVEYIKHLIRNPRAYRQILAVTFTNKATTEMKERILQQLNGIRLGDPASDSYANRILTDLQQEPDGGKWTKQKVQEQANIALHYMLHDYNRFRVETIDSFFQSVMRNLARELEQSPNLNIELNNKEVVADAVESMMEKLTPTSPLLKWLLDYIEERINSNQRWNTTRELKEFSNHIFNEQFIEQGDELRNELKNLEGMKQFIGLLQSTEKEVMEKMLAFANQFFEILDKHELTVNDFSYKTTGASSYFIKLQNGDISHKILTKRVVDGMLSADGWVGKSSKEYKKIFNLAEKELMPLLNAAEKERKQSLNTINSCRKSLKNLHKLQLLNHINEEVSTLNSEKNRFLLSDTNTLLHKLINEGDSSFIFEKMGTQISNIMIDEFQDTSRMQWDNFRLLLLEGLSQGAESLIVGDVKQSIYRWRNGDWGILNNLGRKNPAQPSPLNKYPIKVETLKTNRRSEKRIIDFNNELFSELVNLLNARRLSDLNEECLEIKNAYADVRQESPKATEAGYVKVTFPDENTASEREEAILESIGDEVERMMEMGIKPEQMAILVRQNKQIAPIANYLSAYLNVMVVSDEAFRLDASPAINMLIDALRYLADGEDKISLRNLASNYQRYIANETPSEEQLRTAPQSLLPQAFETDRTALGFMPLYELLEAIYSTLKLNKIANQESYLFTFFDHVSEYVQKEAADITHFLQHWDETLCSKTIQSGNAKGIRAYTIHKSKGLQFHTVLLPYCNWSLETEHQHLMWCKPPTAPYNTYSLLPIDYDQTMADSIYRKEYQTEQLQLWVDSLNTLYVALTRAEKNLFIWGMDCKDKRIDSLLRAALEKVSKTLGGNLYTNEYEYGTLYCEQPQQARQAVGINRLVFKSEKLPVQMEALSQRIEFKQSNESSTFIAGKSEATSWRRFINRGNLLHYIFSQIATKEDAESIIGRLLFDGTISADMEAEVCSLVTEALSHPLVSNWYDGSWKLLNERDIIWMENGKLCNRRPDRVMMLGDKVVVVDFKFGEPRKAHHKQVKSYLALLQRMGHKAENISGYLWYVEKGEVENIGQLDD